MADGGATRVILEDQERKYTNDSLQLWHGIEYGFIVAFSESLNLVRGTQVREENARSQSFICGGQRSVGVSALSSRLKR